jgi:hypothetical protein
LISVIARLIRPRRVLWQQLDSIWKRQTPNKDESHHGFSEKVHRGAPCQV